MTEAVRNGDYLDALQWLNTLAAVEPRFTLTPNEALASNARRPSGAFLDQPETRGSPRSGGGPRSRRARRRAFRVGRLA